jgi:hypothetical protein
MRDYDTILLERGWMKKRGVFFIVLIKAILESVRKRLEQ